MPISNASITDRDKKARRHSSAKRRGKMSDTAVVAMLGRKIHQAMNDEDGDLSQVRKENLKYYTGQPYGDERDGYSGFVTRETFEIVEQALPSILRVFLGSDQIVSFDPVNPEDEALAAQETDIVRHMLMKSNRDGEGGFLTFHHWFKDALMFPVAYIKVWLEEKETCDIGMLTGITAEGVLQVEQDPYAEILEQDARIIMIEQVDPNTGMAQSVPVEVFDLKVKTKKMCKELRVDPIPGNECLVDNKCTSTNLDTAEFVCHRTRKSFSQLVNEGFDPDDIRKAGHREGHQWNDERVARLFYEDENPDEEEETDESMRQFWVHECYVWFDYDGSGVAQHRMVTLVGDKIVENKEIYYQPLIALSAILMQHKHNGMSFIEIVKDFQLLSSTLLRQMMDNIYRFNVGRTAISEDSLTDDGSTMEALLNSQAEYIPVRGVAANAFMPEPRQSLVADILPVIQHIDQRRAMRSGVSPDVSADPNALQEVRQDVFMNAMERASQRIEMVIRIIAETGMRWAMRKAHQILRSNWDVARTLKLRGEWVDFDPQSWKERTDMSVNVGLGVHTKHVTLGLLTQMLSVQQEAGASGLTNPQKIYATLEKMVEAAGVGDARTFFVNPNSPEYQPPEPQPDPNMILAQAQAQALTTEQERKKFEAQAKVQYEQSKTQMDMAVRSAELKQREQETLLKARELAIKERQMVSDGILREGEIEKLAADVRNVVADTEVKQAQAAKYRSDAVLNNVEASDTYREASGIIETQSTDHGSEESQSESETDE